MATGDIGRRIRQARQAFAPGRLRTTDLAKELGVSDGRLSNWERGLHDPPAEIVRKAAYVLKVSPQYLLTGEGKPEAVILGEPLYPVSFEPIAIPYGGLVPCGTWEDPLDTEEFIELESKFSGKGRFAARIEGASMMPMLQPDDIAVFQSYGSRRQRIGHIVLARRSDNAVTLKELGFKDGDFILQALNPKHENAQAEKWEATAFLVGIVRTRGSRVITDYNPEGLSVEKSPGIF